VKNKTNSAVTIFCAAAIFLSLGFQWGEPKKKETVSSPQKTRTMSSTNEMSLPEMMTLLSKNMQSWSSLKPEQKERAVDAALTYYRNTENTAILKPAAFYAAQLDQSFSANPEFLSADILAMVKLLAVVEYDFYNGQDKDELAKQVLGDEMYRTIQTARQ
jgi:hypothetical protein